MLTKENTVLLIIDVQGNLAHQMVQKEILFQGLEKIIKGIRAFKIPVIWIEQNPEGLGPTLPAIARLLENTPKISKQSFSCCGEELFVQTLEKTGKKQVLIAGIEAHVCVYQTALDLVKTGYDVHIICDAISSRTAENKQLALSNMKDAGIMLTSVEMALFELLKRAEGTLFKEIIRIVK